MQNGALLIPSLEILESIHCWEQGKAFLHAKLIEYKGKKGALITYSNPPVHQMGNPALEAYLASFQNIEDGLNELSFLVLDWPPDPVHAGGDLKESLKKLESTQIEAAKLEAAGASPNDVDALYAWGDARLEKGFALYEAMRRVGDKLRTIAVCGGGTRFGGSAEVPLMADWLVGDSRSAMCFSESQIGLIPGWGGVGRAVTKAGPENAKVMSMTCRIVKAKDLMDIGIYDKTVNIDTPLPRMSREGNKEMNKALYLKALEENRTETRKKMLPVALDLAISDELEKKPAGERKILLTENELSEEITKRTNPQNYKTIWGKPLKEVKDEIKTLRKPLAPQSIVELSQLLDDLDMNSYDEKAFIRAESKADAKLYRDPRFREGILATLKQRIANFTEKF